jgi:hypothetical protein
MAFDAPTDAVILPESWIKGSENIAHVAARLAERAHRMNEKTAVLFTGFWITASPPDENSNIAYEAAKAVMWWYFDNNSEYLSRSREENKKRNDEINELKARNNELRARIAGLEK